MSTPIKIPERHVEAKPLQSPPLKGSTLSPRLKVPSSDSFEQILPGHVQETDRGMDVEPELEENESTETSSGSPKEPESAEASEEPFSVYQLLSFVSNWLTRKSEAADCKDFPSISEAEDHEEAMAMSVELLDNFWEEWHYVLSQAEEFALKQAEKNAQTIKEELDALRQKAQNLKLRPYFIQRARVVFGKLPSETLNRLFLPLDASKRSKLILDVITELSQKWLKLIRYTFFTKASFRSEAVDDDFSPLSRSQELVPTKKPAETTASVKAVDTSRRSSIVEVTHRSESDFDAEGWENFETSFKRTAYSTNLVGAMVSLCLKASHGHEGEGLDPTILGDMLWSLWKPLSSAIGQARGQDLTSAECMLTADWIVMALRPIIDLWDTTVRISRTGVENEGVLVKQWEIEAEREKKRLKEIKVQGADARYRDGPVMDKFLEYIARKEPRAHTTGPASHSIIENYEETRSIIESKLMDSFLGHSVSTAS